MHKLIYKPINGWINIGHLHHLISFYLSNQEHPDFNRIHNHSADLVLNRILHVPTVSKNLLSVTKDNSIYFEFHPNVCFVKSQVSNEVLLKGHLGSNGLYTFPKLLSNSTSSSSIAKSTSKTDLLPSIVKSHFPVNSASINTV